MKKVRVPVLILCAMSLIAMLYLFMPFFQPVAWACVLVVPLHPVYSYLYKLLKSKPAAAGISLLVLVAVVIIPVTFMAVLLFKELKELAAVIQEYIRTDQIKLFLDKAESAPYLALFKDMVKGQLHLYRADLLDSAYQFVQAMASYVASHGLLLIRNFVTFLVGLFILLITVFFLLVGYQDIRAFLIALSPLTERETRFFMTKITDTVRATVLGIVIVAIVQGAVGGVGFFFLGLPSPVFWGSMMAVLAMIPFLGAPVIWFPAAVLLLLHGDVLKAVILLAWGGLVVGWIDNLLRPMIIGASTKLHPLLVFFAVFGGILLVGPIGLFLGPVILAVTLAAFELLKQELNS